MRQIFITLFLVLVNTLYAQSSSSQTNVAISKDLIDILGNDELKKSFNDSYQQEKFCKENATELNLLILDDYFIISNQSEPMQMDPDTLTTKIYSANVSRETPQWARVYGVKNASPDSVLAILKEKYLQSKGKLDQDEITVIYPDQEKGIYAYRQFFASIKKIGYSKIRLVNYKNEYSEDIYKKLKIKKYNTKSQCSWHWLRIIENKLTYGLTLKAPPIY